MLHDLLVLVMVFVVSGLLAWVPFPGGSNE